MPTKNSSRETFASAINALQNNSPIEDFDVGEYDEKIRTAFIEFGTGAPDQTDLAELIEYDAVIANNLEELMYGFKVKDKEIFLSSILNRLELGEVPLQVLERHPDITKDEWLAAMRLATAIIEAFTRYKPIE